MTDTSTQPKKEICPYCEETNFPESEFCWACYKNLHPPKEPRLKQNLIDNLAKINSDEESIPSSNPLTLQHSTPPSSAEVQNQENRFSGYGRLVLVVALFLFYLHWLKTDIYFSFLDYINLAFHEAGHLFLGFFGRFIMVLGGTIFQLLIPAVCAAHMRGQNNRLGAQLCVFWFGESLLNISTYAGDAINQALPLLGGGEHDWTYLLTETHLIAHTPATARAIFLAGSAVIFWSLYLIGQDGVNELRLKK